MAVDISIEEIGDVFTVLGTAKGRVLHLLKEAVDDVADEVERTAIDYTPVTDDPDSKSPPGLLKSHPVDRTDRKKTSAAEPGYVAARSEISVTKHIKYAFWTHEGTGFKIAKSRKGMGYKSYGKKYKGLRIVGPNPSQPYLREAARDVESSYLPFRMAELRAELAAIPGLKKSSVVYRPTTFVRGGHSITQSRGPGGRFGPKL